MSGASYTDLEIQPMSAGTGEFDSQNTNTPINTNTNTATSNYDTHSETQEEFQARYLSNFVYRMQNINSYIPAELKEKFCILFGDQVLDHADSYEEIMEKKDKFSCLSVYYYIPHQQAPNQGYMN